MKALKVLFFIFVVIFTHTVFAGPPGFGDTPPPPVPQSGGGASVPIDGGISFFLLAAGGVGSWLVGRKAKKIGDSGQ